MMKMMRTIVAAAVAMITAGATAGAQAPDTERAAVLSTVQKLFDAMRTRDTALLYQVFDSTARLAAVANVGGAPTLRLTTPAQFAAAITRPAADVVWNERMYDPEVRIDGNVAHVWVYYTFHLNDTFSHCGIDAITLIRIGAAWKITYLADTRRTEGCRHTQPPPGE